VGRPAGSVRRHRRRGDRGHANCITEPKIRAVGIQLQSSASFGYENGRTSVLSACNAAKVVPLSRVSHAMMANKAHNLKATELHCAVSMARLRVRAYRVPRHNVVVQATAGSCPRLGGLGRRSCWNQQLAHPINTIPVV
jgi:hypothetical protein